MSRDILFSVTGKDCRWDYYRGSGKGGQKRNKTSSAVRCTHVASGAVGQSDDTRSQHKNKATAFRRMSQTDHFKAWHVLESARLTGTLAQVEEYLDKTMRDHNLVTEGKNERGLWEKIDG
jgi:protein subunit release factor A